MFFVYKVDGCKFFFCTGERRQLVRHAVGNQFFLRFQRFTVSRFTFSRFTFFKVYGFQVFFFFSFYGFKCFKVNDSW